MTLKGQNRAYHTEKKSESEVLAQTCSAELSLSLHNLLPDCFHFIGSAHRTHSSAIPPPLFPPHPPSFSPPFYVLFPSWTRLCLEDDCLLFILVTYFYSHTLLSTHPPPTTTTTPIFLVPSSAITLSSRLQPSLKHTKPHPTLTFCGLLGRDLNGDTHLHSTP